MDARLWHQQAGAISSERGFPPVAMAPAGSSGERQDDRSQLVAHLDGLIVDSVLVERALQRLDRLVERNRHRPPGAKAIVTISAPFAVGKSTFVKGWAQSQYRQALGPAADQPRPCWSPSPGLTADWVPTAYITLRAASKIKDLNASLLAFLGYPSEGLVRVTTSRVVRALGVHGVQLLIVDDIHMLNTRHADGRDVLDYLKFLNTALGELGATMVLVGAHLDGGPIHTDPQIAGRLDKISLTPFEIDTVEGRRDWQTFLKAAERAVLPFLPAARPGVFALENPARIWRRTQGYAGDTVTVLTGALLRALDDGAATVTPQHLDAVPLTARAAANEANLVAAASMSRPAPTRRRHAS